MRAAVSQGVYVSEAFCTKQSVLQFKPVSMRPQVSFARCYGVALACLLAVVLTVTSVGAQELVECYTTSERCMPSSGQPQRLSDVSECCLGEGLSYSFVDGESCSLCIVFGLSNTSLTAVEQGESYTIEIGYLKGAGTSNPVVFNVQITAEGLTADISDFTIAPRSFNFISPFVNRTLQVNFRVDAVALEPDETFRVNLTVGGGLPFGAFLVDSAEFTIIDGDVLGIGFTEDHYRALEQGLIMPVVVTKDAIIASDITLTVTPLTVAEAEALGIQAPNVPPEDPSGFGLGLENTRARSTFPQDFDPAVQIITFLADEGVPGAFPNRDIRVPISIIDDERDEPDQEVFVAALNVTSVSNTVRAGAVVVVTRNASLATIVDDDSISIGFERESYTVEEQDSVIHDLVFLVKQDNRITERGFITIIRALDIAPIGSNPATIGVDYALSERTVRDVVILFPREQQQGNISILLFDDEEIEPLEAFQLSVVSSQIGPVFLPADGVSAFRSTVVQIIDNEVSTREPVVTLVEGSPSVSGRDVTVTFNTTNRNLLSLIICRIEGPGRARPMVQDCSSGQARFQNLDNRAGRFTLIIEGQLLNNGSIALLQRDFRIDSRICSVHVINSVVVRNSVATIEWQATGPSEAGRPTTFSCRLDRRVTQECSSPFIWSGLSPGPHRLRVRPAVVPGCTRASNTVVLFEN